MQRGGKGCCHISCREEGRGLRKWSFFAYAGLEHSKVVCSGGGLRVARVCVVCCSFGLLVGSSRCIVMCIMLLSSRLWGGKGIGIVVVLPMLALSTARSMCSCDGVMESRGLHLL